MTSTTFKATIVREGPVCFMPITFDPRTVFGRVRAPVKVTLSGFTLRSTIVEARSRRRVVRPDRPCAGPIAWCGLDGGDSLDVRLHLDAEKRVVRAPANVCKALKARPSPWA